MVIGITQYPRALNYAQVISEQSLCPERTPEEYPEFSSFLNFRIGCFFILLCKNFYTRVSKMAAQNDAFVKSFFEYCKKHPSTAKLLSVGGCFRLTYLHWPPSGAALFKIRFILDGCSRATATIFGLRSRLDSFSDTRDRRKKTRQRQGNPQ